ncbi:MAG: glycosyltransferase family 4 protein [Deltaproteobacteria bacterium]|nr:glycosyltransferase family 4 protein [Deltaproteobacteria bacterium]
MKPPLLFATPTFGRAAGGLGVSADRITRHLAESYEPVVLVADPLLPSFSYEEDPRDPAGRRLVRFWWKNGSPTAAQFFADVAAHYLKDDCAWAAAFYVGELAFPLVQTARLHGARSALFARGNDIDLDLFSPSAFHVHRALSDADAVFAVSGEMCRKIRTFARSARPVFVGNGVDVDLFRPAEGQRPPVGDRRLVLGLFGEIKGKKGLDLLLEAVDFERFELRIVGRLHDDVARHLHGFLTYRPEVLPSVQLIPYCHEPAALVRHYQACDAVCIPSVHDGMPNVLLEAMASGCVCVASAVGGTKDLIDVGVNGFLFESRSVEDLIRVLAEAEAYLRSEPEGGRLRFEARRTVEERGSQEREGRLYREHLLQAPLRMGRRRPK